MTTGKVIQFRRGRHTITEKQMLIEIEGVESREDAAKLIGKSVEWEISCGKKLSKGKFLELMEIKVLLGLFLKKGLPGQIGHN